MKRTSRSTRSRTSPTRRSSSTRSGTGAPTSSRTRSPTRSSRPSSARRRSRRSAASPTSASPTSTSSSRTAPTSTGPAPASSSTSRRSREACPQGVKTEIGPDATSVGWVFQYALVDETGHERTDELRTVPGLDPALRRPVGPGRRRGRDGRRLAEAVPGHGRPERPLGATACRSRASPRRSG